MFWAADSATAGTVDIKGIIYTFGGADNWVPSDVLTLETGLDASSQLPGGQYGDRSRRPRGRLPPDLAAHSGGIFEQRFSMTGDLVGHQTQIDNQ